MWLHYSWEGAVREGVAGGGALLSPLLAQSMLFHQQEIHLTCLPGSQGPDHAELSPAEESMSYLELLFPRKGKMYPPLLPGFLVLPAMGDCLDLPSQLAVSSILQG